MVNILEFAQGTLSQSVLTTVPKGEKLFKELCLKLDSTLTEQDLSDLLDDGYFDCDGNIIILTHPDIRLDKDD